MHVQSDGVSVPEDNSDYAYEPRPPCECGNPDASWHGPENGHRTYACDECYNWPRSGARNPWRGCGPDPRPPKHSR